MKPIPIRWRVTGAFSAAFVVVMTAVATLVVAWFAHDLGEAADQALRVRTEALVAAQSASGSVLPLGGSTVGFDESPTQILDPQGRPLTSTAGLQVPLLTPDQTRRALSGPLLTIRPGDAALDESLRLLAHPGALSDGSTVIIVAAASQDEIIERVQSLAAISSIGLLGALVLCTAGGYVAAGVALNPVDAMRRDAETVSTTGHGQLSTPETDDEIGRLGRTLNTMLVRIRHAREHEQASLQRERQFVSDASHELRTPLTVLRTEVELAVSAPRPSIDQLHAALISAGEETARLCRLTEDLLTLAHTHALGSHPQDVNLAALLTGIIGEYQDLARDNGRTLTLTCAIPTHVFVDETLIRIAVGNLVSNALRHAHGPIACEARHSGTDLVIDVTDHGPGFHPDFLPHATERFSRADTARHGPSTGLGLAITDAVARAHHGHLRIENHTRGARVSLHLPTARPDTDAAARSPHPADPIAAEQFSLPQ